MILEGVFDLTAYQNEILGPNKLQQQKKHFLIPDNWKPWEVWGSHLKTDTNTKNDNWTQREKHSMDKRAQNPKTNSSSDLAGPTHF